MNLEVYLRENTIDAEQEEIHSLFVETICRNLDKLGINPPYQTFKEVRLRDPKKDKSYEPPEPKLPKLINQEFYRQSDLVILNSDLYVIEAKVIRVDDHEKREAGKIRMIRKQLPQAYCFFKNNFQEHPILIGAYKRLNAKHFYYYHQDPGGRMPLDSEILQISC